MENIENDVMCLEPFIEQIHIYYNNYMKFYKFIRIRKKKKKNGFYIQCKTARCIGKIDTQLRIEIRFYITNFS